jgi:hypothetical protein
MPADLVLSEDPHDVPPERLTRIDVLRVFVGEILEIRAPGYDVLRPKEPG